MTWLTVAEAAERLRISPNLLYAMCAAREIPHHRMGRGTVRPRIRFDEGDLAAYAKATRVLPSA